MHLVWHWCGRASLGVQGAGVVRVGGPLQALLQRVVRAEQQPRAQPLRRCTRSLLLKSPLRLLPAVGFAHTSVMSDGWAAVTPPVRPDQGWYHACVERYSNRRPCAEEISRGKSCGDMGAHSRCSAFCAAALAVATFASLERRAALWAAIARACAMPYPNSSPTCGPRQSPEHSNPAA